ncbi:hypothetical protein D9M68_906870 [compost metagenome]
MASGWLSLSLSSMASRKAAYRPVASPNWRAKPLSQVRFVMLPRWAANWLWTASGKVKCISKATISAKASWNARLSTLVGSL